MQEVELLPGYTKLNTSAYHLQTDSLVEQYNCTFIAMLAKIVGKAGPEWVEHYLYVLFACRVSQQTLTQESPFYPLYGRDPKLLVPLSFQRECLTIGVKEYEIVLYAKLSSAWELARQSLQQAQKRKDTA